MTISVVQTAISGNLSSPAVFGSPVTPGNTVVAFGSAYAFGAAMSANAPTLGGSTVAGETQLESQLSTGGGNQLESVWILPAIATVPGDGVTVAFTFNNSTGTVGVLAFEVAGLGSSPVLDQSTGAFGTGGNVTAGPTGAIAHAPEIVLAGSTIFGQALSSPSGGFTAIATPNDFTWAGYQIAASSGGAYSWTQSNTAIADWAVVIVTLYATGGGTAHTATVSLTVTPSRTISRVGAHPRTTSLTVTPVRSMSRIGAHPRTTSLTVTPARTISRIGAHPRTTSLTVTPARAISRVGAHPRTVSTMVTVNRATTRIGSHPRTTSLTVTPSRAITTVHAHFRTVMLAATVNRSVARTGSHPRAVTLTVIPARLVSRSAAYHRSASFTAVPVTRVVPSGGGTLPSVTFRLQTARITWQLYNARSTWQVNGARNQ